MTTITFQNGNVVMSGGAVNVGDKCCCNCQKCVQYSFIERGDLTVDPPPEPAINTYVAMRRGNSCLEKEHCFDFEFVPDAIQGQLGPGCGFASQQIFEPWSWLCRSLDETYVYGKSEGGKPCARVRCNQAGDYFLDICAFNTCFGTEAGAGRLTRKTYALTVGEDGCPESVGEEVASSVTDWVLNVVAGQWVPASDYGYDLDGEINNTPLCNQECWSEEAFDFVVCEVVGDDCDCNAFP